MASQLKLFVSMLLVIFGSLLPYSVCLTIFGSNTGRPRKRRVWFVRNIEKCIGYILKSHKIVNLYRGMSQLKLKIIVNLPQLLCIVVSVALNGEFE